jgi:hypothetical protein
MRVIYKYMFDAGEEVTITMPADAEILKVETQNGLPCMWVLVNPQ